jgi:hypothetical protein
MTACTVHLQLLPYLKTCLCLLCYGTKSFCWIYYYLVTLQSLFHTWRGCLMRMCFWERVGPLTNLCALWLTAHLLTWCTMWGSTCHSLTLLVLFISLQRMSTMRHCQRGENWVLFYVCVLVFMHTSCSLYNCGTGKVKWSFPCTRLKVMLWL